jgi:hypothetical protein
MTIWRFFLGLAGWESSQRCRQCDEAIGPSDPFGRSEGVCEPCRNDH